MFKFDLISKCKFCHFDLDIYINNSDEYGTHPDKDPLPCAVSIQMKYLPFLCCIGVVRDGTVVKTSVDDEDKA
jgi:hypothetical protein